MADMATIEPTVTSVSREGQALTLEMESLKDVKFLNNQLVQFGIRNLRRVNEYLERLDRVMAGTDDERIVVAGAAVAVNALKAVVTAIKSDLGATATNTFNGPVQINVDADLTGMTDDQLRAYIAARLGSGGSGAGSP